LAVLPEAAFPEATHRPEAASKLPPSSRRAPAGRTSAQQTVGQFRASPAVHSCRGRRMHPETSSSIFWSQAGTLVAHKRVAALLIPRRATPRSCSPRTAPSWTALGELFSTKPVMAKQHLSLAVDT
jgi:hypothetical protein